MNLKSAQIFQTHQFFFFWTSIFRKVNMNDQSTLTQFINKAWSVSANHTLYVQMSPSASPVRVGTVTSCTFQYKYKGVPPRTGSPINIHKLKVETSGESKDVDSSFRLDDGGQMYFVADNKFSLFKGVPHWQQVPELVSLYQQYPKQGKFLKLFLEGTEPAQAIVPSPSIPLSPVVHSSQTSASEMFAETPVSEQQGSANINRSLFSARPGTHSSAVAPIFVRGERALSQPSGSMSIFDLLLFLYIQS